jgi:hypothetical protein
LPDGSPLTDSDSRAAGLGQGADPVQEAKPRLELMPKPMTFENLLAFFRRLMGREPSPEEVERVKARWEEHGAQEQQSNPPRTSANEPKS